MIILYRHVFITDLQALLARHPGAVAIRRDGHYDIGLVLSAEAA